MQKCLQMARFLEPLLCTANVGGMGAWKTLSAAHSSAWGPEVPVTLEA